MYKISVLMNSRGGLNTSFDNNKGYILSKEKGGNQG